MAGRRKGTGRPKKSVARAARVTSKAESRVSTAQTTADRAAITKGLVCWTLKHHGSDALARAVDDLNYQIRQLCRSQIPRAPTPPRTQGAPTTRSTHAQPISAPGS